MTIHKQELQPLYRGLFEKIQIINVCKKTVVVTNTCQDICQDFREGWTLNVLYICPVSHVQLL